MTTDHCHTQILVLILAVLAVACPPATAAESEFVGSASCAGCHQAEFDAWLGSHHDLAMQPATRDTVLGTFDEAEISVHGVTSRFFTRDGKFYVHTDGPDGEMADFEIAYTFGVEPLQQYLVPFPDGRVQALGLAWDSRPESEGGQRWFHLYPEVPIDHADELHWTGRQQNWNDRCADCHSTNFVKGYDIEADRFESSFSEIDVACESCHGPGSGHEAWAAQDDQLRAADIEKGLGILLRDRAGVGWQMDRDTGIAKRSTSLANPVEVGVCADCHSRRGTLAGGGQADPELLDHHMPVLLTESLYFPDGQMQDEVYVWGSFKQSRMHAAGVTCSDCHEPHSLDLRAEGDPVCFQCHLPAQFAVTAHHGHQQSDGRPACVDCHMPERTYMEIDRRRDHSIRVPRPDLTAESGVPNACNGCHADKSVEWAVAAFASMYPNAAEPFQGWTAAFVLARKGLPQSEAALLRVIDDDEAPDIARATAVFELAPFLSPLSGQAVQDALRDDAPLVRLAALRTLEALPPEHRFAFAGHLVGDPLLAIRAEAGRVLAASPPEALNSETGPALRSAIDEYIATQLYSGDRPESWVNLGNLRLQTGNLQQADNDYRRAMKLAPEFSGGYLNLADLYRQQGREVEAREVLEQGIERQPNDAELQHSLGLSLIRSQDGQGALAHLEKAAELAPENARFSYVYAVALNSSGRSEEAVNALTAAHARHPYDTRLMQTLAVFERDKGNVTGARRWAEKSLEVDPRDQTVRQFLKSLPPDSPAPYE